MTTITSTPTPIPVKVKTTLTPEKKLEFLQVFEGEDLVQNTKKVLDFMFSKDIKENFLVMKMKNKIPIKKIHSKAINFQGITDEQRESYNKLIDALNKLSIFNPEEWKKRARRAMILERPNSLPSLIKRLKENAVQFDTKLGIKIDINLTEHLPYFGVGLLLLRRKSEIASKRIDILKELINYEQSYFKKIKKGKSESKTLEEKENEAEEVVLLIKNYKKKKTIKDYSEHRKIFKKQYQLIPNERINTKVSNFPYVIISHTNIFAVELAKRIRNMIIKSKKPTKKFPDTRQYAFLLYGRTGSGKTFFWQEYSKEFAKEMTRDWVNGDISDDDTKERFYVKRDVTKGYYTNKIGKLYVIEEKKDDKETEGLPHFTVYHKEELVDGELARKKFYKYSTRFTGKVSRIGLGLLPGPSPHRDSDKNFFGVVYKKNRDEKRKRGRLLPFSDNYTDLTNEETLKEVLMDQRMEVVRQKPLHSSTRNHIEKLIVIGKKKQNEPLNFGFKIKFLIFAGSEGEDKKVDQKKLIGKPDPVWFGDIKLPNVKDKELIREIIRKEKEFLRYSRKIITNLDATPFRRSAPILEKKMKTVIDINKRKMGLILFVWPAGYDNIYRTETTKNLQLANKFIELNIKNKKGTLFGKEKKKKKKRKRKRINSNVTNHSNEEEGEDELYDYTDDDNDDDGGDSTDGGEEEEEEEEEIQE